MSSCAASFATAIADPFSAGAVGACIPDQSSGKTWKCTSRTRYVANIGTAGLGFAYISPSVAQDAPCIYYSKSAFTGNLENDTPFIMGATGPLPGVATGSATNLPVYSYQLVNFANRDSAPFTGRIVSAGVRLAYTGTTDNLSGIVRTVKMPSNGPVSHFSADYLDQQETCSVATFERGEMYTVRSYPTNEAEVRFPNETDSYSGTHALWPLSSNQQNWLQKVQSSPPAAAPASDTYTWNAPMASGYTATINSAPPIAGIIFTGVPGSTVLIEYIVHVEYSGAAAVHSSTPTAADPNGTSTVINGSIKTDVSSAAKGKTDAGNWYLQFAQELQGELAQKITFDPKAAARAAMLGINWMSQTQRSSQLGNDPYAGVKYAMLQNRR